MKGLIVCRTGMGSSLMLKIKAQKVIDKLGYRAGTRRPLRVTNLARY